MVEVEWDGVVVDLWFGGRSQLGALKVLASGVKLLHHRPATFDCDILGGMLATSSLDGP